jgi:hypothetical protein
MDRSLVGVFSGIEVAAVDGTEVDPQHCRRSLTVLRKGVVY